MTNALNIMPKLRGDHARNESTKALPSGGEVRQVRRARVRIARATLPSGRVIDLLDPRPSMWTEEDIADAMVKFRGRFTVAELCLQRLTMFGIAAARPPKRAEALRELLYFAAPNLLSADGGTREFSPPRRCLPEVRRSEVERLRAAIFAHYGVPPATEAEKTIRSLAGRLDAAAWRHYVDGQSIARVLRVKSVAVAPPPLDAFPSPPGPPPWEPLPHWQARTRCLAELRRLIELPDGPA